MWSAVDSVLFLLLFYICGVIIFSIDKVRRIMFMENNKKIIITVLSVLVVAMAVGYALLA